MVGSGLVGYGGLLSESAVHALIEGFLILQRGWSLALAVGGVGERLAGME